MLFLSRKRMSTPHTLQVGSTGRCPILRRVVEALITFEVSGDLDPTGVLIMVAGALLSVTWGASEASFLGEDDLRLGSLTASGGVIISIYTLLRQ